MKESYTIIVEEANSRGGDSTMEVQETNTLVGALSIVETLTKRYLPEYDSQFVIKLMPTSIYPGTTL